MNPAAEDWVLIVGSLPFAVWGFYGAYGFKNGRFRRGARWYFDRTQPRYVRNLPFVLLPGGFLAASGIVVIACHELTALWAEALVAVAGVVALGSIVLALFWVWRPPTFLKPDWMRDREARPGAGSR